MPLFSKCTEWPQDRSIFRFQISKFTTLDEISLTNAS